MSPECVFAKTTRDFISVSLLQSKCDPRPYGGLLRKIKRSRAELTDLSVNVFHFV